MAFMLDTEMANVTNIKVIGVGGGGGNAVNRMLLDLSLIHICSIGRVSTGGEAYPGIFQGCHWGQPCPSW